MRLLEPRVEAAAGTPGSRCARGPRNTTSRSSPAAVGTLAQRGQALGVAAGGDLGAHRGHAEVGQVDRREPCRCHARSLLSPAVSTGRPTPTRARCRGTGRPRPSSTGPTSPSGHVTRTWASVAGPMPTCVQPSWPPMWPPPTTTSRRTAPASPAFVSITAPIASRLPPGWLSRSASQPPIGAGASADPAADVAPDPHRRPEVRLDQVEQAVLVEVGERGAAAAIERHDARRLRALDERPVGLAEEQVARIALSRSRASRRRCPWTRTGPSGRRC